MLKLDSVSINPDSITFNGISIDKLFYNGIQVWPVTPPTPSDQPCDELWYTSTNGSRISTDIYYMGEVVSNTYVDGKGIAKFKNCLVSLHEPFNSTNYLRTVQIPNTVLKIESGAFWKSPRLTEVTFAEGCQLNEIDNIAFDSCSSLTRFDFPSSVTTMGHSVFHECSGLTSVTFPSDSRLTTMSNGNFYHCAALPTISFPNSLTEISSATCMNCYSLTSVTFGSETRIIGESSFQDCWKLDNVVLPSKVTTIYDDAFLNCSGMTNVTIPKSVTSIGALAFAGCTKLKDIYYNGTCDEWEAIEKGFDWDFEMPSDYVVHCQVTTKFYYTSTDGNIIRPSKDTSYKNEYVDGVGTLTVKGVVTSLGTSKFQNCTNLKTMIIPNVISNLGLYSFYNCTNLTTISFEEDSSLDTIGYNVFDGCNSLAHIYYNGTSTQFASIQKDSRWAYNAPTSCIVHCSDGDFPISNF